MKDIIKKVTIVWPSNKVFTGKSTKPSTYYTDFNSTSHQVGSYLAQSRDLLAKTNVTLRDSKGRFVSYKNPLVQPILAYAVMCLRDFPTGD